jgi:hypothetical protein
VLKFARTKGGPPKVGQVILLHGRHPTQKIITTWGSYVITKIDGVADLRHFPSKLDGLSHADLVHAYREVLFDAKSEPRSLWKSVGELSPEIFLALPDVLMEAMVGQPPRAVFQSVSRLSWRTEPRSDQEYHEALENLQTWHQFPAHRALSYKEDTRGRRSRQRMKQQGAKPSPLRHVTNINDIGNGASMIPARYRRVRAIVLTSTQPSTSNTLQAATFSVTPGPSSPRSCSARHRSKRHRASKGTLGLDGK